uniref:Uncharacterized protein n=1 Tax=Cucumis melo TaxID=3656 RepID=A0A9I9EHM1_CUCME
MIKEKQIGYHNLLGGLSLTKQHSSLTRQHSQNSSSLPKPELLFIILNSNITPNNILNISVLTFRNKDHQDTYHHIIIILLLFCYKH